MVVCPFCGVVTAENSTCAAPECLEASARVSQCVTYSRGTPNIRGSQHEADRVRGRWSVRMQPSISARVVAAAKREGLTLADYVERWALTLPPADDP